MKFPIPEIFEDLRREIFESDYEAVDAWFDKNFHSLKPNDRKKMERKLVDYIMQESYFFSYRSFAMDRESLRKEDLKHQISVFKHLELDSQVYLLSATCVNDRISPELFKVLKERKDREDIIKKDSGIAYYMTKLFFDHQFSEIEQVESILKMDLLNNFSQYFGVYRKNQGFFVRAKENFFSPKHDIIMNFTEEKEHYLRSRGIELPTVQEGHRIVKHIMDYLKDLNTNYIHSYGESVSQQTAPYFKVMLARSLDEELAHSSHIKSRKI